MRSSRASGRSTVPLGYVLGYPAVFDRRPLAAIEARPLGEIPPAAGVLELPWRYRNRQPTHCSSRGDMESVRRLDPTPRSLPYMPQTSPDLSLPLAQPITLSRGPGSHLVTLMDAAVLIRDLEPFRQARTVWDRAAEMILIAASSGEALILRKRRGSFTSRSVMKTG